MAATATIIGHLGQDAETRDVGEKQVASLSVAAKTGWGDRAVTTWWRVSIWGAPTEWVGRLRKGECVTCIGEPSIRSYTDREGAERQSLELRATEVISHTPRAAEQRPTDRQPSAAPPRQPTARPQPARQGWGDDVPF